jgi:hypothetical protein
MLRPSCLPATLGVHCLTDPLHSQRCAASGSPLEMGHGEPDGRRDPPAPSKLGPQPPIAAEAARILNEAWKDPD